MRRTKWVYRSFALWLGGEVWDDLSDHPAWDWLLAGRGNTAGIAILRS